MSDITLQISKNVPNCKLHHLPCNIKHNGPANVEKFFLSSVGLHENDDKKQSAVFRGRPLDGEHIDLPEEYVGFVLKENRRPFNEDEDRKFHATGKFKDFTEWHLDSRYTSSNTTNTMLKEWMAISKAVHDPVTVEPEET